LRFGWAHRLGKNSSLLKKPFLCRPATLRLGDIQALPASNIRDIRSPPKVSFICGRKIGIIFPGLFNSFPGPDCLVKNLNFVNEKPPAGKEGQKNEKAPVA